MFDHIADCLESFVTSRGLEGRSLPLGFTFSFPCQQISLTESRLIAWTKGYDASGVEGKDVAQMLRDAIKRRTVSTIPFSPLIDDAVLVRFQGGRVEVVAVLNDTVGTLMALAHEDAECEIGIILGKSVLHLHLLQTVILRI